MSDFQVTFLEQPVIGHRCRITHGDQAGHTAIVTNMGKHPTNTNWLRVQTKTGAICEGPVQKATTGQVTLTPTPTLTAESFWGKESVALHQDPEQWERQAAGAQIAIDPTLLDAESKTLVIKDYVVSLDRCSCMDCSIRRLPCKHMYRLAYELGIFDLGVERLYGPRFPENVISVSSRELKDFADEFTEDTQKAFCDLLYIHVYKPRWSNILLNRDPALKELTDAGLIMALNSSMSAVKLPVFLSMWMEAILEGEAVACKKTGTRSGSVKLAIIEPCGWQFVEVSVSPAAEQHAVALYRHLRSRHEWLLDPATLDQITPDKLSTRIYAEYLDDRKKGTNSMDIRGLDDFNRSMDRLGSKIQEIGGEHEVDMAELLTPELMVEYTQYPSMIEFFAAVGVDTTEDLNALSTETLDDHVAKTTQFGSWQEMMKRATNDYVLRKLEL